ncbi:Zinc transporter, ZIP family [hydrothermal vent metagenome]|uniref:Zinc transporter, ZIP family n=1 Tax=hydrothermal vent metagenome TaxID=652676 RepID=A0A3B0Y9M2_9ZZZZ
MSVLAWIIIFSLLGGTLSAIAASVMLLFGESLRRLMIPHLVSIAIGTLLGAAFLALLPHAMEPVPITGGHALSYVHQMSFGLSDKNLLATPAIDMHELAFMVLLGILGFFLLEKMVLWRHCHSDHCVAHTPVGSNSEERDHQHHKQVENGQNKSRITLILIGDGIHNLVDGVLIAAAFLIDIHLGIVTTIALAAHEIPQEVGDFAILLNSGMKRSRAFFYNLLSSLTTVVGALIAYFSFSSASGALPYVLAIASSSFIYIAVADLIPGLHERTALRDALTQFGLIISGVLVIYLTHSTLH